MLSVKPKAEAKIVLDASAVLAYLKREPGYKKVRQALAAGAAISTVNLAEVFTKVQARRLPPEAVSSRLHSLGLTPVPFTEEDAWLAATEFYLFIQAKDLSLGDRACLALGRRLGLPILTADRVWGELNAGLEIQVIR